MNHKNIVLFLMFFLCGLTAEARIGGIGFFRSTQPRLSFGTTAQTNYKGICSTSVSVQTRNASGVVTNVTSNLTVNLTTSHNVTFYSDSNCSSPITSITVSSGSSSAVFYFVGDATGALSYTASATGYQDATQSSTINVNPFLWTGGGANANWSTALNWAGGAAPSTNSHVAYFDGTCTSNCSPTITSSTSIGGIRMASTYVGTITQNSSVTVTLNSAFVAMGGTFTASSTSTDKVVAHTFALGGATVNANAITLEAVNWKVSGGSFNAGTSTLTITGQTWSTAYVDAGSANYNNVTIKNNGYSSTINFSGQTMKVYGTLTGSTSAASATNLSNGTIEAYGSIALTDGGFTSGSALIKVAGSTSQSLSATGSNVSIGNFEVASTGGTVSYSGTINFNGNYKVTSGTIDAGTSSLIFTLASSYTSLTITPGTENYNDITFNQGSYSTFQLANDLNVHGTLYGQLSSSGNINSTSSVIKAYGNVSLSNGGLGRGTTLIKMAGNTNQTITGGGASSGLPHFEIASTGGVVSLAGTLNFFGNYTVTSGTIDAGTSTVVFTTGSWSTRSITPGSETYNNVTLNIDGYAGVRTLSGTMNVAGTLSGTAVDRGNYNGGTVNMTGATYNLSGYGHGSGSTIIKLARAGAQTVNVTGSNVIIPSLQLAASGGVSIIGSPTVAGAASITAGTASLSGASDTFSTLSLSLNGNTFTKNGGAIRVNGTTIGSGALYGGTVAP